MVKRADIIASARTTLGTRWKHQGRLPGAGASAGIDCLGLLVFVAKDTGIKDIKTFAYQRDAKWRELLKHFDEHAIRIQREDLREADMVVFWDYGLPCHCGIITAPFPDPWFIHSTALARKVVEVRYTPDWQNKTVAYYRYHGLED